MTIKIMSNFEQKKRGRPRRTDPHFCSPLCGYNTFDLANLARHRLTCKKIEIHNSRESILEERVSSLHKELTTKEQELATINQHLADTKDQLAVKDERISTLELMLGQQFLELKQELKETKKRKDDYTSKSAIRKRRTEPERRQIAKRQNWRCANPDGGCLLPGELEEYDVDHVVPVWKGGSDDLENLQALCRVATGGRPIRSGPRCVAPKVCVARKVCETPEVCEAPEVCVATRCCGWPVGECHRWVLGFQIQKISWRPRTVRSPRRMSR